MKAEEDDFRRRYAELSDEGLLSTNRDELVELARHCFDQELAERGLQYEQETSEEPADVADDFVAAATFLFADEAEVARSLLRSCYILCYLENEHTLTMVWAWSYVLRGLRLMVPASLLEDVHEILNEILPEEDLTTQVGMAALLESSEDETQLTHDQGRRGGRARTMLIMGIVFSPAVDLLRIFYVGR